MNPDRPHGRVRMIVSLTAFAALPLALAAPGCDALLGIEDLSASGTGGNSQFQCELPTDCPGAGNACFTRDCVGGVCEVSELGANQPVSSQVDGDCKLVVCNEDGTTREDADPSDPPNDSLECTDDACNGVEPAFSPKAAGATCSTGVCDGAGNCVECATVQQCGANELCLMNQCVAESCNDGVKNGDETAKDCGGTCPKCGTGKACLGPSDCLTGVCEGNVCQAAACDDLKLNGDETDVDCGGGTCDPCTHDKKCMVGTDCESKVCDCPAAMPNCVQQVCQVATCTDGVQNGNEAAADCGPTCLGQCQTGDPCEANNWCFSLVCDVTGSQQCLEATCDDGVKNGTEIGVDCGGMSGGEICPACG